VAVCRDAKRLLQPLRRARRAGIHRAVEDDVIEPGRQIVTADRVPILVLVSRRAYEILWSLKGHDKWHVFTFVAQRTRRCPKTKREFVKGERYPMTYYGIGTNRRRKWKKAGVDARLHDTRHTTGQRTLRATGNLKLVQTLLRHTEIRTTAKFYTDTTMADLRDGMERTESQKKSQTENSSPAKPMKDKA
jgi:integrase